MDIKKPFSIVIPLILILSGLAMGSLDRADNVQELRGGPNIGPTAVDIRPAGPVYNGSTLHVGAGQTYAKIQAALDDSEDRDIIIVHPGKYVENVVVDTAVHIQGMKGAIIDGSSLVAITVSTSNVTVSGMNINNSNNGVYSTSLGLNLSDNVFYRNTIDVRFDVSNTLLTRDYISYPVEIINNTIDHASTSNMIDIAVSLGSNWVPVNITVGPIMIAKNKVTNTQNRGYGIRIRETVSFVKNASLSLGGVNIIRNNFTLLDYGASIVRTVTDLQNMDVRIGGIRIEGNGIVNPRTQGVLITNTFSKWAGTTLGEMDPIMVKGNRVVTNSFNTQGITINPVQFTSCAEEASLNIEGIDISGNFINVSNRAIYLNNLPPMNTCFGNASMTLGNISMTDNTVISRSSYGISYTLSTLSLGVNTSARFGRVLFARNRVTSSFTQGIYIVMTDMTSAMSGNAVFAHGGFFFTANNVSSSSYGIYLNFLRLGKGAAGSSRFSMGDIEIIKNNLTGSNGLRVILNDALTSADGRSRVSMGDFNVTSNIIKSTAQSVYFSFITVAYRLRGWSSVSMGTVRVFNNNLTSNTDGIYGIFDTMASDLSGNSTAVIGGVLMEGNRIAPTAYGVQIARMRFVGQVLYQNSSVDMDFLSISKNEITKGTGITVGVLSYLGYTLYDNSTFEMGGLRVEDNEIDSSSSGLVIGQVSYLGSLLWDSSSSTIGEFTLRGNDVFSSQTGISLNQVNNFASGVFDSSMSEMKGIHVDENVISSGTRGVNVGSLIGMAVQVMGTSSSDFSGLSISDNEIQVGSDGVYLGTCSDIIGSNGDDATARVGALEVSHNRIVAGGVGIDMSEYGRVGTMNWGNSNSSTEGLLFSGNIIRSERDGIRIQSLDQIAMDLGGGSRTEVKGIGIEENEIISNYSGIMVYNFGYMSYGCVQNATSVIGRIGVDRNDITANQTGIYFVGVGGMLSNALGNASASIGELTINDNSVASKDYGLVAQLQIGGQSNGTPELDLGEVSFSMNDITSLLGATVAIEIGPVLGNSSLKLGSLAFDGNTLQGSEVNGLELLFSYRLRENSSLSVEDFSISENRVSDANWSAVKVVQARNLSKNSTFDVPGIVFVHNNLTLSSLALNLTGCEGVLAYLNNFIGNGLDVLSNSSSVAWDSPEKMWYRHKNRNYSNYVGNYWDRYTGPDANDDGIGDEPYDTGAGQDLYPFTSNVDDHFPPWNDVTPPSVAIIEPVDGSYINYTSITIRWEGSDDIMGIVAYSIRLDGGGWTDKGLAVLHELTDVAEGPHVIEVRAFDLAGNENTTSSSFFVDLTDPHAAIISPSDGAYLDTDEIALTWEGSDSPSGLDRFEVRLDEGMWIEKGLQTVHTFTDVPDGGHSVSLKAFDLAGNQFLDSVEVTIDTGIPELLITSPVQGSYYNTSEIKAGWTVTDMSGVEIELRLDEMDPVTLDGVTEFELTGLTHGVHILTIKGTDRAGNMKEGTVSFTVDLLDPEASLLSPARYIRSPSVIVILEVNGTGSPVADLYISLDEGNSSIVDQFYYQNDTMEFSLNKVEEGDHTIDFDLTDKAGNHWRHKALFTIDVTVPRVFSATPQGNDVRTDTVITVEFSEAMDVADLDFDMGALGETTWNDNVLTFTPSALLAPMTSYTVWIKGTDLAGNSLVHSWKFTTASKGTIVGRVLDEDGDPVPGAMIMLDTGETATTGEDGRFTIGAPQGTRTVRIFLDGEELDDFFLEVTAGVVTDAGDREVKVPSGREDGEYSWLWIVLVASIILLAILILVFFLVRRSRGGEAEEEWGMDPDDWEE